jgi:hypothetical protein
MRINLARTQVEALYVAVQGFISDELDEGGDRAKARMWERLTKKLEKALHDHPPSARERASALERERQSEAFWLKMANDNKSGERP